MVTDFDLFTYFDTYGVKPLRRSVTITGIVNIGNGLYRINTGSTKAYELDSNYPLVSGMSIEITGATGFNGKYEIDTIVTNTSFVINRKYNETTKLFEAINASITIPTLTAAKWINVCPTFEHDRLDRLNLRTNQYVTGLQKYPIIIIPEGLTRQYQRSFSGTYNISIKGFEILSLVRLNENWNRTQWEDNAFKLTRLLIMQIVNNLELTGDIINIPQFKTVENIEITDYFQPFAMRDKAEILDFGATGCLAKFDLLIENAGKICNNG